MITGSIGDIFVRLGVTTENMTSGFSQAERLLESMGNKLFYMGARLSAGITAPLLVAGSAIVKWGLEFDNAMTESLSIMEDSAQGMRGEMEKTARVVSETTSFSAKQAAEAYYDLGSAGLNATEAMKSLQTVAQFAQAGVMDLAHAGEYLAGAVASVGDKSLGTEGKVAGMAKMADVLTQANNKALGTIEDFSKAISTRAGQAMRMYNISVEEGVSVLMAYAKQNIKGAAAGQQFWMMTRDMQRAISKNTEEWQKLGIEVYDINGNMNNLADILAQMETAFAGLSDKQRNMALATLGLQDRSKAATLALMGLSKEIKQYQVELYKAGGATAKVAGKQMESLSKQLTSLYHQFQNIAIDLFKEFKPVIEYWVIPAFKALNKAFQELVDWFHTLTEKQKLWVIGVTAGVMALGPLLTALGSLLLLVRALSSPMGMAVQMIGQLAGVAGAKGIGATLGRVAARMTGRGAATAAATGAAAAGGTGMAAAMAADEAAVVSWSQKMVTGMASVSSAFDKTQARSAMIEGMSKRSWAFWETARKATTDYTDDVVKGMSRAGNAVKTGAKFLGENVSWWTRLVAMVGRFLPIAARLVGFFGGWQVKLALIVWTIKDMVGGWQRLVDLLDRLTGGKVTQLIKGFQDLWRLITDITELLINMGRVGVAWFGDLYDWASRVLNRFTDIQTKKREMREEDERANAKPLKDRELGWLEMLNAQIDLYLLKRQKLSGGPDPGRPGATPTNPLGVFAPNWGFPLTDISQFAGSNAAIPGWKPDPYRVIDLEDEEERAARKAAEKAAAEEAKRKAEEFQELVEEMSGAKAIREANEMLDVMKLLPPVQYLTAAAQEKINETMSAALAVYKAMKTEAPAAIRTAYNETYNASEAITKLKEEHAKFNREELERIADPKTWKGLTAAADLRADIFADGVSAMGDIDDEFSSQFDTERDRQLNAANKWQADMFKRLQPIAREFPDLWKTMAGRVNKIYDGMTRTAEQAARDAYDAAVDSGTATTEELDRLWGDWWTIHNKNQNAVMTRFNKNIRGLSDSFKSLSKVATGSWADIMNGMYGALEALEQTGGSADKFKVAWAQMTDPNASKELKDRAEQMGNVAMAMVQMAAAVWTSTGEGSPTMRAISGGLSGAMAGMALGTMFGAKAGPYGAAAGAAIGATVGAIRGRISNREAGQLAADDYRSGFIDQLDLKQWAELRDSGMDAGDGMRKHAAMTIFLRDAYRKLGYGINEVEADMRALQWAETQGDKKVAEVQRQIEEKLKYLKERSEHAAKFVERLGNAYDYLTEKGRLASKQLLDMTATAKAMGGATEVLSQRVVKSMDLMLGGMTDALGDAENLTDDALMAMTGALAAFVVEMRNNGFSMIEILEKIKDPAKKLIEALDKAGLAGTDAFVGLHTMISYLDDEGFMKGFTAISGMNDMLVALHNTGLLTADMFKALSSNMSATFNRLVDAGYDANTILHMMAPSLQTLWELQQDFGYAVDDGTQALIDQGLTQGIIGEHMRDASEQLKGVMEDLVAVMKDFVDTMKAMRAPFDKLIPEDEWESIWNPFKAYKDRELTWESLWKLVQQRGYDARYQRLLAEEAGFDPDKPIPQYLDPRMPGFATGAFVTEPTAALVGEGPSDEYVVPEPMMEQEIDDAIRRARAEFGEVEPGSSYEEAMTVNVTVNTISSAEFEQVIDTKMVPAILTAVRRNRRGAKTEFTKLTTRY